MDKDSKYTVLFKSLESVRDDKQNNSIFEIIDQSNVIRNHYDYLKQFCNDNETIESIGFTRT